MDIELKVSSKRFYLSFVHQALLAILFFNVFHVCMSFTVRVA